MKLLPRIKKNTSYLQYLKKIVQTKDIQYGGDNNYSYYLNKQINSTFTFRNIYEIIVKKTISNLPTKIVVDMMTYHQNY